MLYKTKNDFITGNNRGKDRMIYPAHIKDGKIQTVQEHCRKTAFYAGECLKNVGLKETGYLAGLLHDSGKFTNAFKDYIEAAVGGQNVKRGSVNHTFAGVKFLLDTYHNEKVSGFEDFASEIIAYGIGAHHGLFDCVDENKKNGFKYRQDKQDIFFDEAMDNFREYCADAAELDERFSKAKTEIEKIVYEKLAKICSDEAEADFYYGLLCRLVLSAVIEGDRRDTAEFMQCSNFNTVTRIDWQQLLNTVETKLREFPLSSAMDSARRIISEKCAVAASLPGGIYRLNVPTGGGKTLASLRYALKHADIWHKERIVYVMPLLAIIEQNAGVIKDFIGDASLVLEHHSNVVAPEDKDELDIRELLVETWDAPIIVTTLVQLLNTLFKHRTTSIRRFKSLQNSILIFDEVQTVPNKMLSLFNMACNFLSGACGCTIILCSATQPLLEKTEHSLVGNVKNLIELDKEVLNTFDRVDLIDVGSYDKENIIALAIDTCEKYGSILVVCNTKAEANDIFKGIYERADAGVSKLFLSANMCVEHRRSVIEKIKTSLQQKKKLICVSTQVIEAGVDVSFASVIRLQAGMDSIVQAAGRCNRHAELAGLAPVYVVNLNNEKLTHLKEIGLGKTSTTSLLVDFKQYPDTYDSLISDKAIDFYYKKFYQGMNCGYMDFFVPGIGNTLFDLMSSNKKYADDKTVLHQALKTACSTFEVFETETTSVIVPYGEGEGIIAELISNRGINDLAYQKNLVKKLKGYTVNVYAYQLEKLKEVGALGYLEDLNCYFLSENFYDKVQGLVMEPCYDNVMIY